MYKWIESELAWLKGVEVEMLPLKFKLVVSRWKTSEPVVWIFSINKGYHFSFIESYACLKRKMRIDVNIVGWGHGKR